MRPRAWGAGGSVASAGVVSASWYSLEDRKGVVFILNVTDPATAHEMLEKLPLGQAHLMSFELIPIGPLNPLRWLQGMKTMP